LQLNRGSFGGLREVAIVKSLSGRSDLRMCLLIVATCLLLVLPVGCGRGGVTTPSSSASSRAPVTSSSPSSRALSNIELRYTLRRLRNELKAAYGLGRDGKPFEPAPAANAALRTWFAAFAADPSARNGASRLVFLRAVRMPAPPGGLRSTANQRYVSALFWADGPKMVAAGGWAPGLNEMIVRVTRRSADAPWRADGPIYP
jgi:hypothetical protein